ncbi:hypothetical protein [Halomarina oriensis]|uniref:Uncharacterized protein n=1 Tax=Halomarina oriensis TaxID=671145 RepID=A0A6B0GTH2_9EURY|nr:hypothetical protein [Halomarina oriensis]MWG35913.1 hypothetical protein [Halomarina oriensis]
MKRTSSTKVTITLRAYRAAALCLPEPDADPWLLRDIDGLNLTALREFHQIGAVEQVDRVYPDNRKTQGLVYRWSTDREAYKYISEHFSEEQMMPCGHEPLRNLRDGGFSCRNDDCDAEFSRAVAEAVTGWKSTDRANMSEKSLRECFYSPPHSVESVQPGDSPEIRTDGGEAVDTESDEPDPPSWQWEGASAPDGSHILTGYSNEGRFSLRLRDEDLMFLRDWANRSLDEDGGEQA